MSLAEALAELGWQPRPSPDGGLALGVQHAGTTWQTLLLQDDLGLRVLGTLPLSGPGREEALGEAVLLVNRWLDVGHFLWIEGRIVLRSAIPLVSAGLIEAAVSAHVDTRARYLPVFEAVAKGRSPGSALEDLGE